MMTWTIPMVSCLCILDLHLFFWKKQNKTWKTCCPLQVVFISLNFESLFLQTSMTTTLNKRIWNLMKFHQSTCILWQKGLASIFLKMETCGWIFLKKKNPPLSIFSAIHQWTSSYKWGLAHKLARIKLWRWTNI